MSKSSLAALLLFNMFEATDPDEEKIRIFEATAEKRRNFTHKQRETALNLITNPNSVPELEQSTKDWLKCIDILGSFYPEDADEYKIALLLYKMQEQEIIPPNE